ncbi:MAG: hypothetical protein ACTTJO_01480 [Metamycoplasmataceae bacterium]
MYKKITKTQFLNDIKNYQHPIYVVELKQKENILEYKAICKLNDLKVPKPPKEPDMTVGNLNIQELTSIIKTVVVENTLSREDVIQIVRQEIKPIQDDIKEIKEDIKMLKSFHVQDIENYYKNK